MVGDTLRNGATEILRKPTDKPHVDIVLCFYEGKFVTWVFNRTVAKGECTSGHYYTEQEFDEAYADYKERT